MEKQEKYHRLVDGGKMHPQTVKIVNEMNNQKFIFSGFNILIYAQNYILTLASTQDDNLVLEDNREGLYALYEYALELEPKPEREELTFSQHQMVNKARQFVTMKMKRRQNLRSQKQSTKEMLKIKKMMSDQLKMKQHSVQKEIEEEEIQQLHMEKAEKKKKLEMSAYKVNDEESKSYLEIPVKEGKKSPSKITSDDAPEKMKKVGVSTEMSKNDEDETVI